MCCWRSRRKIKEVFWQARPLLTHSNGRPLRLDSWTLTFMVGTLTQPARSPMFARRPLLTIFMSLLIFGLSVLNMWLPLVRFTMHVMNVGFCLLVACVPWLALIVARRSSLWKDWRKRLALILLLVPILLVSILVGPLQLLFDPFMLGVKRMTTLRTGGYQVSAYLLDCGVLCSFEIEIQQERILIPPIMVVRNLAHYDDTYDALLEIVSPNQLRVTALRYDPKHPEDPLRLTESLSSKAFFILLTPQSY